MTVEGAPPRAGRREWLGLAVLALPTLLVSIDLFVLLLALPHLSADLEASSTQQLWILDIYGFMLAGFLITMGTLGDRIGRRRLLLIGAAAFAVASVLAAYVDQPRDADPRPGAAGHRRRDADAVHAGADQQHVPQPQAAGRGIGVWVGLVHGRRRGRPGRRRRAARVLLVGLGVPARRAGDGAAAVVGPVLLPEHRDPKPAGSTWSAWHCPWRPSCRSSTASRSWPGTAGSSCRSRLVLGRRLGVVFVRRQRALPDPLLDLRCSPTARSAPRWSACSAYTMLPGGHAARHPVPPAGRGPVAAAAGLWMLPAVAGDRRRAVAPMLARRSARPT